MSFVNWKQMKAAGVRLYGDIQSHWGEMKGEADEHRCGNVTKYEYGHMWAHPRQCCSDVVSIHPCASIRMCLARVFWKAVSACLCLLYDSVWPLSLIHI